MVTNDPIDTNEYYKKNLDFWETAWSRVKKPYKKLAPLSYLPDIPKAFKEQGSKHILDMACGSGWLCFYLNDWGFDCTGVDISKSAIDMAKLWAQEGGDIDYGEPNGVKDASIKEDSCVSGESQDPGQLRPPEGINRGQSKFYAMDMMAMDFPEDSFDGILMNAMFEHLDYERGKEFLHFIKKFIKPDGLMFAIYDKVNTGNKGEFVTLEDGTRAYTDNMREGMFLRYYPDDELRALLEETGWSLQSWDKTDNESRIVLALNKK